VSNLVQQFKEYSEWRKNLVTALEKYRKGLDENALSDAASNQRFQNMLSRLTDDKLSIAFVSEFSRGKSELINAIFFAEYGQRIVPSSAGRTTMCPAALNSPAAHRNPRWQRVDQRFPHAGTCLDRVPVKYRLCRWHDGSLQPG
jgi:hypothetical protein